MKKFWDWIGRIFKMEGYGDEDLKEQIKTELNSSQEENIVQEIKQENIEGEAIAENISVGEKDGKRG